MTKLNIEFTNNSWSDYVQWKKEDRSMIKKIDKLISDTIRHPFSGLGKPEPLKHQLAGKWSRRISGEHRLVYGVTADRIIIYQVRFHYE